MKQCKRYSIGIVILSIVSIILSSGLPSKSAMASTQLEPLAVVAQQTEPGQNLPHFNVIECAFDKVKEERETLATAIALQELIEKIF